ncbi:MAG TPA: right-handed parallel beta-helix repeat-containing protein, partial [Micropepsaceae bacterium]|nr:right-handed parallel beta-helix repeat-containing protein [Micropepsaceae bacterium]
MRASGKPGCRVAIIAGALCFAAHSANAQNSNAVLFDSIQPSAKIWVSAGTNGDGDGSPDRPFKRIQDAVSSARAGTAIMVKAGEYHENVKLPSVSPGTLTAPIWLMSADGPEAAKIVAASEKLAAIYGYGTDNFIVKDFLIEGGKNGIQFSQSGRTFTNMVENILVEGNTVLNAVEDGIKIDQAKNVQILGNIVRTTGQEDIDFVAVNNSVIAYNDVSGASGAAGIMVKGGSTSVAVLANKVHDIPVADGIMVGGSTGEQFFVPGFTGYEAKDVTISDNEVRHVAKRPLNFLGAVDSRATHNFF